MDKQEQNVTDDVDLTALDSDTNDATDASDEIPTLTQSKVNELIGRTKQAAYIKAKREIMQELEKEAQQQATQQNAAQNAQAPNSQIDIEKLQAQIHDNLLKEMQAEQERLLAEQQAQQMNQIANDYYTKMAKGREMYDDFDEIMKDFDPRDFKHLVLLATQMDNTVDILRELSINPTRLSDIDSLAIKSPALARRELEKLNKSIVANKDAAASNRQVAEPLSRMKPSSGASADGGAMTLRDMKSKYRV